MGKVIGLDLGTRTLGIAISDSLGMIAYGRETHRFENGNFKEAATYAVEYAKKEGVTEIALGLPLHMNGDVGDHAQSAMRFKEEMLALNPNLKIALVDERMSTMLATRRLLEADLSRKKRKQVIDKMAAVVILETYLDSRH